MTKRGTNAFHGTASGYFTHDDLQWSNIPDELVGDPRLQGNDKADHTQQISDMTFDLGSPILKDKLWFYSSYGRNDIRIRNISQQFDKTLLKAYSAKLNWQATGSDMISVFWFQGGKIKSGRTGSAAAAGNLTYLDGTLWDQGKEWPGQPQAQQGRVEPRVRSQLLPDGPRPPATTRVQPDPQGGWRTATGCGTTCARRPAAPPGQAFARPQDTLSSTAATSRTAWRQPRAQVRPRLPRRRQHQLAHQPRQQGAGHLQRPRRAPASTATRSTPPRATTSRRTWATPSPRTASP